MPATRAAAAAAGGGGNSAHDVACPVASGHQIRRDQGHEGRLVALRTGHQGAEDDNGAAQPLSEPAALLAQGLKAGGLNPGGKHADPANLADLGGQSSHGLFGQLALQPLGLAVGGGQVRFQGLGLGHHGLRRGLKYLAHRGQQAQPLVDVLLGGSASDGLNAAQTRADAALGGDLEVANLAGPMHVGAAAQLSGEVAGAQRGLFFLTRLNLLAHGDHANGIAILLAKEGGGAILNGLGIGKDSGPHWQVGADGGVHLSLNAAQLVGGHALQVGEVKAQPFGRH
jgi:hypothetical protein